MTPESVHFGFGLVVFVVRDVPLSGVPSMTALAFAILGMAFVAVVGLIGGMVALAFGWLTEQFHRWMDRKA